MCDRNTQKSLLQNVLRLCFCCSLPQDGSSSSLPPLENNNHSCAWTRTNKPFVESFYNANSNLWKFCSYPVKHVLEFWQNLLYSQAQQVFWRVHSSSGLVSSYLPLFPPGLWGCRCTPPPRNFDKNTPMMSPIIQDTILWHGHAVWASSLKKKRDIWSSFVWTSGLMKEECSGRVGLEDLPCAIPQKAPKLTEQGFRVVFDKFVGLRGSPYLGPSEVALRATSPDP